MQYKLTVKETDKNKRLDMFLLEQVPNMSRSQIKKLIDEKQVFVNSEPVKKAGYALNVADEIAFEIATQKPSDIVAQDLPLEIIYEDEYLAVINKPQGMVVHPAAGNHDGTLVNALLHHFEKLSDTNSSVRPGIVHRLDKDTSGLLVIAKTNEAHANLAQQIKEKTARRTYLAIVSGVVSADKGVIDKNLARSQKDRKKIAIVQAGKGKTAITNYKVLKRLNGFTYMQFDLQTGRTHQIRVHAKHIGHPVLGDATYGHTFKKIKLAGQLLHAHKLSFTHPVSGKFMQFEAPLPEYFLKTLKILDN